MSTPAVNANPRLAALAAAGTSPWLDQIRRSLIETGELARLRDELSLRGVTSNPAIFEKAILGSADYDDQIAEMAKAGADDRAIFRALAVADVGAAADVLRPVFDEHQDGFVSLEVDPDLAFDTDKTMAQAREYWQELDRPNVMIKIPGTLEGVPAIEQATYEGINVNVTLLFSVEAYAQVAEAYIKGLERRHAEGKSVDDIHSVASFFVSRVDTEVDKRLAKLGREDLRGKAAIANARNAYKKFQDVFEGERFAQLREAGANVQRPLWASTGVKDPAYPETMYVDTLVAPHTVNTMPMATLHAVAERSEIREDTALEDPADDLKALADAGIDLEDVTGLLLRDGVDKFVTPMEALLRGIESKREAIVTHRPTTLDASLPSELEKPVADEVERAVSEEVAQRVWARDPTLWGGTTDTPELANRLGWLTVGEQMSEQVDDLEAFAHELKEEGFTDAVVLGMGGSSLAPEVFARSFEPTCLRLHVLDSTDADAIAAIEKATRDEKTIYVVSTKSGGTIETRSLADHFWSRTPDGKHFVAITDPGSSLEDLAKERGFRRTFLADPDIGGRYSALSPFGLVPAALMGAPVQALLDGAAVAEEACSAADPGAGNSGLWLGAALGALAKGGRDKLTFVVDDRIASFGLWVEQLVAESTGKHGRGILPVADEPLGEPGDYGDDRVFVHLRGDDDEPLTSLIDAGHPVLTLPIEGPEDLGRIFFFAEFATAVAGWSLGINPFDQPNVQEAKDNTTKALEEAAEEPFASAAEAIRALLDDARPPAYVAIMAYAAPSEEIDAAAAELRRAIRARTKATTTFGYGPRFLHSTGQYHKGGTATGRFLQLVHDAADDVEVPDKRFTFEQLKRAQAVGDFRTLREHGLPAQRVRLEGDPAEAIRALAREVG
ncbi:MAG TPA: bifunctional transaldolase/phosoglucose isomerase [Solirubrobacteraceae bacterium]|jgi:transaldolase/glucose-6-phosphate isomerase